MAIVSAVSFEANELKYGLQVQDAGESQAARLIKRVFSCQKRSQTLVEEYKEEVGRVDGVYYDQISKDPSLIVNDIGRSFVGKYESHPLRKTDFRKEARDIYTRILEKPVISEEELNGKRNDRS